MAADHTIGSRIGALSFHRRGGFARIQRVIGVVSQFLEERPVFRVYPVYVGEQGMDKSGEGYGLRLNLVQQTYVRLHFYYEEVSLPANHEEVHLKYTTRRGLSAEIPSLYSSIGRGTGFFLLHVAMLIAIASGALDITLDNDTDEPLRAARGVYRLFEHDPRVGDPQYYRGMSREERNQYAERVHYVGDKSMGAVKEALLERVRAEIKKEEGMEEANRVWREDAVETIAGLFEEVKGRMGRAGTTFMGGGRRRASTRRKARGKGGKGGKSGKGRGRLRRTRYRL